MIVKGKELPGPIRDENPCYKCQEPTRHLGCHDSCKRHSKWKAEVDRVSRNRREYVQQVGIGIRKKK